MWLYWNGNSRNVGMISVLYIVLLQIALDKLIFNSFIANLLQRESLSTVRVELAELIHAVSYFTKLYSAPTVAYTTQEY